MNYISKTKEYLNENNANKVILQSIQNHLNNFKNLHKQSMTGVCFLSRKYWSTHTEKILCCQNKMIVRNNKRDFIEATYCSRHEKNLDITLNISTSFTSKYINKTNIIGEKEMQFIYLLSIHLHLQCLFDCSFKI